MSSLPSLSQHPASSRDHGSHSRPPRENIINSNNNKELPPLPPSTSRRPRPQRPAVQIDAGSSSSDSDSPPSSKKPSRTQHLRSMSQPFSLLTGGTSKRQDYNATPSSRFEMGGHDAQMLRQPSSQAHRRGGPAGSKDFATGNCMTCASLMRWPKDLKVFKCTICLTINDLVPVSRPPKTTAVGPHREDSGYPPDPSSVVPPSRGRSLSLEHTRRLIRQGIRSYISRRLATASSQAGDEIPPSSERSSFRDGNPAGRVVRDHGKPIPIRSGPPEASGPRHLGSQRSPDEEVTPHQRPGPAPRASSFSHSDWPRPNMPVPAPDDVPKQRRKDPSSTPDDDPKRIFKQLEEYIIDCFGHFECINHSFVAHQQRGHAKARKASITRKPVPTREQMPPRPRETNKTEYQIDQTVCDLDAKLLLLGDFAENGTWWAGAQSPSVPTKSPQNQAESTSLPSISSKPAPVNWTEVDDWYATIINCAEGWFSLYDEVLQDPGLVRPTEQGLEVLERELLYAQEHVHRVLLKATEMLLKRPGRLIAEPGDIRFLLILMDNPLFHSDTRPFRGFLQSVSPTLPHARDVRSKGLPNSGPLSGQNSGLIKRIVGLLSNSPSECHNQFISWAANFHTSRFSRTKDLMSGFLTYRMLRQNDKKQQETPVDITAGLIPQMQSGRSGAYLYEEIGTSSSNKKHKEQTKKSTYMDDWQVKASCRVLALLFAANSLVHGRRIDDGTENANDFRSSAPRERVHAYGRLLPTTDFYNSMIDNVDLVADFEAWESKRNCFSFCQYPFLLSIWAKTQVLEYDARRQMQMKARDAWFESIMNQKNTTQFLSLNVRRDCLVEDSLTAVSEVIGSGGEDVKKRLRIAFRGEEGIDAGGLRKEWFLLLIREVFNPDHGMFVYDEDSQFCYFNPNSFETSDQFFLVGVVIGLAIYNSTILDVALPPVAFRKLLASAPAHGTGAAAHPKPALRYTLDDLAEYQPRLARGLRQLLDYDGDVEATFCLDFVVEYPKYGTTVQIPLCPNGERKPVTNGNRREYVDLYVRYVLDTSVTRQFEPFKRGFYTVCGGNAFSLFKPEEIELLVRGSDEPLDIDSLRAVAEYDGWSTRKPDGTEPVVGWFWDSFQGATPSDQRKMLLFITGSDRIPATGAATLAIKISCLGDDCGRYPIARTCFNLLSLWRYSSRGKLETMLWRAVRESEGFGLK